MSDNKYMPGHYDGDGCTFPDPGHFAPRSNQSIRGDCECLLDGRPCVNCAADPMMAGNEETTRDCAQAILHAVRGTHD